MIVNNSRELDVALRRYYNNFENQFKLLLKKLGTDSFKSLVDKSAKDTSFMASQLSVSVNTRPASTIVNKPPGATSNQYQVATLVPEDDDTLFGNIIYFFNNTAYIMYLEYGIGQRAQPMIRPTLIEFRRVAQEIKRQLASTSFIG